MRDCRADGYKVNLVFVALDSPGLNVRRVAERVSRGGHDIPEDVIRRRYEALLHRLPAAVATADNILISDNSQFESQMLAAVERGSITGQSLDRAKALHVRIAEALGEGLDLSADAVFRTNRNGQSAPCL